MFNFLEFKAAMARNGYTQAALAKEIGISPRTLTNRIKTGDFGSKEIEIITKVLKLKDPMHIFFSAK